MVSGRPKSYVLGHLSVGLVTGLQIPLTMRWPWAIGQVMWGKGYATEWVRSLMNKGFREWGVERVLAPIYEENQASRRVLEKVGMALVRRFRLAPEDIANAHTNHSETLEVWDGEEMEYALERADWR
ncbi:MAG: GNAT family N-acetyltransferase [Candidatus Latescibacterota bacterium]